MIRFGAPVCASLDLACRKEWIETNGLGGFASSTIIGLNTRRYHGLLTAATNPPVGRQLLLAKLEETLVVDGRRYELSCNRYPGAVHPQGQLLQVEFRMDPFPVFVWNVEGRTLEKRVFMVHGENTTVVEYELIGAASDCTLELRPLIAFRDYHSTTHCNDSIQNSFHEEDGLISLQPYQGGAATLHLAHTGAGILSTGHWYRNFEYDIERERGLDFQEDLYNPLVASFELHARPLAVVVASTTRKEARSAGSLRAAEIARRAAAIAHAPCDNPLVKELTAAASQFIVARGQLKTVIAGYHWFSDWGRDTMIALPGLTLVTGRPEIARDILNAFSRHVDQGMLPNRFPDAGEPPEYNTVDATLWFFEAVRSYLQYTGDYGFVEQHLYRALAGIIDWHVKGTRFGIRMESDGLLRCGEPGSQLTWMDAKAGDWVVTPRHGKPVEIQALWYNALRVMADLAERFGDTASAARFQTMAEHVRTSFTQQFWNDAVRCLYDVVDGEMKDGSMRPNQIFAASLHHPILDLDHSALVVEAVGRELFTPVGLRSLSPFDPRYRGIYEGDPWHRDGAYHQGTVWPWLTGPYITAYVRVHQGSKEAKAQAARWLEDFRGHMSEAGLGQISEIFDGDAPHRPHGCIAQAWSVSELLRAAVEDIYTAVGQGAGSAAKGTSTGYRPNFKGLLPSGPEVL
ncbi:MAG: glycogen debranching enzyme family protein [Acidobacteriia bacterium]|nr:glycogen debranching enzyme family protein [Terriglobia bacterium]